MYIEMQQGKNFLTETTGWRKSTRDPVEVDFIVKTHEATIPVEVKCAEKVSEKHLLGLRNYMQITGGKKGVLVGTSKYQERIVPEGVLVVLPVYLAELSLMRV